MAGTPYGSGCLFSSQGSLPGRSVRESSPLDYESPSCSSRLDIPSTSHYPPNFSPLPIPAHIRRQIYVDGLSYTDDDFDADKFSRDLFVSGELCKPPLPGDSEATSSVFPICRICHQPGDEANALISPCRCTGSLQYVHGACLKKWLEVSSKKSRRHPKCELCRFQYQRHKKFKFRHLHFPRVSIRDKILHLIFILNIAIMVSCAVATVLCFLTDQKRIHQNLEANDDAGTSTNVKEKVDLAPDEIVTLTCGVVFFVSFFIAMTAQIKAKHTIYQLCAKVIMQNMEWEIDEYDRAKDTMFKGKAQGVFV